MKRCTAICIALALLFAFAGCSGSEPAQPETAAVETAALRSAQEWLRYLKSRLPFDDQMTDTDRAAALYGIMEEDGYTGDTAMCISTMATPEEIAVFRADSVYTADALCALAEARIAQQKASYASYAPQEVPKLDSAVIQVCGDYVIVCVCADNALAAQVIDDAA